MTYQNNHYRASRYQKSKTPKWPFVLIAIFAACLLIGSAYLVFKNVSKLTKKDAQSSAPAETFDKKQFSLSDPTSPWVVVNKKRPLVPNTYAPASLVVPSMSLDAPASTPSMQLNSEAAAALDLLDTAARAAGINLVVASAYRAYDTQKLIYDSEVQGFGQVQADRESARPGHSEHQTGWAVDLGAASGKCRIEACFADTPEGKWLAANAHTYGFIIRYAKGKEPVTGYNYEPWHLRYVGTVLSAEMHRTGIQTLEEFFGLPAATNY